MASEPTACAMRLVEQIQEFTIRQGTVFFDKKELARMIDRAYPPVDGEKVATQLARDICYEQHRVEMAIPVVTDLIKRAFAGLAMPQPSASVREADAPEDKCDWCDLPRSQHERPGVAKHPFKPSSPPAPSGDGRERAHDFAVSAFNELINILKERLARNGAEYDRLILREIRLADLRSENTRLLKARELDNVAMRDLRAEANGLLTENARLKVERDARARHGL